MQKWPPHTKPVESTKAKRRPRRQTYPRNSGAIPKPHTSPTRIHWSKVAMKSPFPSRSIEKTDPEYQNSNRHVFVLQPPLEGATLDDIARFSQDLTLGIDARTLLESHSIHQSSFGDRGLTLETLTNAVANVVSRNPIEWIRGCVGVSVIHNPGDSRKLTVVLSALPESPRFPGQKLLSVSHGDDVFDFKVALHENRFIPVGSLVIGMDNPLDPAAEHFVTSDRGALLTFTDIYADKKVMEYFAMASLFQDLIRNYGISRSDLTCQYEPLGNTFPDFELCIRGHEWAVEVTRIEEGMVSYLRIRDSVDQTTIDKAAEKRITSERLVDAVTMAITEKSDRRDKCFVYSRACLVLVDVVDAIEIANATLWENVSFDSFDVVVVVKFDGSVAYISGSLCPGGDLAV